MWAGSVYRQKTEVNTERALIGYGSKFALLVYGLMGWQPMTG